MKVPKQPELNLGMVGHVDHGKTSLTQALTGEWTDKHSEEVKRGITIRLGYADCTFYKCPSCEDPKCYGTEPKCKNCGSETEFQRAISFVDSPGHETLMATMLSGAALMDGALLLIAANEPCPQPQTKEHLMALQISGVDKIVIVQNKIDLVTRDEAKENYLQIMKFIKGTIAENAPIIPISAHHTANLDMLLKVIQETVPSPTRDLDKPARLFVGRSFDINKPGTSPGDLKGGIIGGSLIQGRLRVGDEIEILPGRRVDDHGKTVRVPIHARVTSVATGGEMYDELLPGGLGAIGTMLDPYLTKSDSLIGTMVGHPGTLPPVWNEFSMECNLLERVVGSSKDIEVAPIRTNEALMLNAGGASTVGIVTSAHGGTADVRLKIPICIDSSQRIAISRRVGGRWRLIGYGIMKS